MKSLQGKLFLSLLALTTALSGVHCNSKTASEPLVKEPADPNIVAKIGKYVIVRTELERALLGELYPSQYNYFKTDTRPADANSVLMQMLADKAMIMEARKQGYLNDETLDLMIKRYRDRRLANQLLQNYLQQMKDQIIVTEAEIEQKIKADPNTNRARFKATLENTRARNFVNQYYKQLYEKYHIKKLSENYPQAIKIHDRLLNHPKTPLKMKRIMNNQIKEEMTPEERNITMATYDNGGKITLEDWFYTLCEFSPPSRPKNLNTPEGIDLILERALMLPIYVTEAKLQNIDKDETFVKQLSVYEDNVLLNKTKGDKYREVRDAGEPTPEEILAYYNDNKEAFTTGKVMNIDQILCQDLETAKKAKAELDGGKDFESVKKEYSLDKARKPSKTFPSNEGLFWKDLWPAEPNDIVGPIKGFRNQEIKWRIVKVLDKKEGQLQEYSDKLDSRIKSNMLSERGAALVKEYGLEILKKYKYEIYYDRIKDIDPLNIP
ncbi:MAG: peptidyl-prolyl cis-trans isomerase [Sedimentisphaerales bacterium]|nr:peptidyl-prolyl cis-trans isomerase [Sedimentisphaerales bacterium]